MKMRVKTYWVVICGLVVLGGVVGGYLVIASKKRTANQPIAFILQSGVSASSFVRSIRDAVDLFSQTTQIPVKRYTPNGTPAETLRVLRQIHADGIHKVVGPLTSGEFDDAVQQFIADHSDMIVITPSATSPSIGSKIRMPNFFRFIASDDVLVNMYLPFMSARVPNLKNLIVLSRDDGWGKSLDASIKKNARERFASLIVSSFFYTVPEKFTNNEEFSNYFAGIIQRMREVLAKAHGPTAIMLNTFAELNQYVYLVHKDPLFAVPHFGSDALVYSGVPFEDAVIAKFLAAVKFEILVFFASNALSTKRFTVAEQLVAQQKKYSLPLLMPSLHAFAAYDALMCLSLCDEVADVRKVLSKFYGTTGFIELDERGNRHRGSFLGVGTVFDGTSYRWMPLSLSKHDVYLNNFKTLERCLVDLAPSYEISWDKSWNAEAEIIGFDLTDRSRFKPADNVIKAQIGAYVLLYFKSGDIELKFMVYPALASGGVQVYVNLLTKDQWTKQATDNLYLAAHADNFVVKKPESTPIPSVEVTVPTKPAELSATVVASVASKT